MVADHLWLIKKIRKQFALKKYTFLKNFQPGKVIQMKRAPFNSFPKLHIL